MTELVAGTEQLGTHLDALTTSRSATAPTTADRVASSPADAGVNRLGVETVPQIVTRGWLVDVSGLGPAPATRSASTTRRPRARARGRGAVPHRLERALGTIPSLPVRRARARAELAAWLAEHGVALTGCDTWSYGPVRPRTPSRPFEVPQTSTSRHGIFVVESLDTEELAAAGVREFALILTHPKLRGATGAWTSPIALV